MNRTVNILLLSMLIATLAQSWACITVSRSYYQDTYERTLGEQRVVLRDALMLQYETGTAIGGEKQRSLTRNLYYLGQQGSTIALLWEKVDRSPGSTVSVEKVSLKYEIIQFPFTIAVRGFIIQIHQADHFQVTYSILDAKPVDIPK